MKKPNSKNLKKILKITVIIVLVLGSVIFIVDEMQYYFGIGPYSGMPFADKACNVAGVELRGELLTYYDPEYQMADDVSTADDIIYLLGEAEELPHIEVVLLEIDSYGGSPVATEEVMRTIREKVTKPVVVLIREYGISGAYWIASAGDIIYASELSEIGGIGVTQSYLDYSINNQKEGFVFNELNTARFKDMLNPEKPLTREERALIQRDLDIIHEAFVASVATNRRMEREQIEVLADGSTMLGQMALENGLIDEIGGTADIKNILGSRYDTEPVICW